MKATFNTKISVFSGQLWKYHLVVPKEVANPFIENNHKRVVCEINGTYKWQAALMKTKEYWFILLNQQIIDQCSLAMTSELVIKIAADTSEFGIDMPEEFSEILFQDELLKDYFTKLTPGKQRNLLYIINKVKSSESRLKKVMAIAHHLKETKGAIDYKLLNETIKQFNKLAY